jgi:uncharacterized membrane protein YoaK (UPF0700 family)
MRPALPFLLSFTGGYVDTAGFLALQGLFTAHVTGNFVTLGASLVLGISGATAKLLALPVFCVVVVAVTLLSRWLTRRSLPALQAMLALQFLLLSLGCTLGIALGPFPNGDAWPALAVGMVLVAAMAIQNAAHRSHLTSAPPSTLMTGTTTQIMIDLADLIAGRLKNDDAALRSRLSRMSLAVGLFAAGCASAALLFAALNVRCFALFPILGGLAVGLARPLSGAARNSV